MGRSFALLALLALVACAGGGNEAESDDGKGGLRQPCFGNGTCNLGLQCVGGACVEVGRGGDLECCHTSDFSCDLSTLTCVGQPGIPLCVQQGTGGPHQSCYQNGTCNAGLVCKGLVCVTAAENVPDCSASGSAGSGTAGSGTAGTGTAGSGTAGSGTAGSATAGSGTAGTGTAGTGTAGTGTAGSGPTCTDCVCANAPSKAWDNACVMQCIKSPQCTQFIDCSAVDAGQGLPACMCNCA